MRHGIPPNLKKFIETMTDKQRDNINTFLCEYPTEDNPERQRHLENLSKKDGK